MVHTYTRTPWYTRTQADTRTSSEAGRSVLATMCFRGGMPTLNKLLAASDVLTSHSVTDEPFGRDVLQHGLCLKFEH